MGPSEARSDEAGVRRGADGEVADTRRRPGVGEAGAAAAEYVAMVVLVAALAGAVSLGGSVIAATVSDTVRWALSCIAETGCPAGDGVAAGDGADAASDGVSADQDRPAPVTDDAAAPPLGPAARREAAVHDQLRTEAQRIGELADRELGDLAVWDELRDLEERLTSPTRTDQEREADLDRLDQLRRQLADAPDGSLLAELRDTEHLWADPFRREEDHERLRELLDRMARAEHAGDLAPLLEGWAASDRRFLHLEIDLDDGTVRLAELVRGDLDDSGHVAIVIPGTGSDAAGFDGGVHQNARALAEELDLLGRRGDDVSVIACQCYAPPPRLIDAGSSRYADAGGPDLARIIGGLPVREGTQLHGLGHSYGSTALGRAVSEHGLQLNDTVSLGGPGFGSGIQDVTDLPNTAGRVWGVRHDLDPIDLAGMHGRNPDRGGFGAYGFGVGDDGLDRRWWKPYIFDAHSIYYQDAESLRNLALLVSGHHDEVSGYREGRP